ncbi:MAG: DUF469 family protein [Alphaproteobacteria bacterium]|nr:DUF469 family protein [Alphaproteobacteria bacterium]
MNKRLRKKKRVGEFQELGFAVGAEVASSASPDDIDAFVDRLVAAVEARELCIGGGIGGDGALHGYVTRAGNGGATERDRADLASFLTREPLVVRHLVGPLCDAWSWSG